MKNVMTKAWEIAKKGQQKFGGKVKEYFAQALRMAWAIAKKAVIKTIGCTTGKNKTWVAKLTDTDPRYGFKREFVNEFYEDGDYHVYELEDGVYDIKGYSTPANYYTREFVRVENGQVKTITKYQAKDIVA